MAFNSKSLTADQKAAIRKLKEIECAAARIIDTIRIDGVSARDALAQFEIEAKKRKLV